MECTRETIEIVAYISNHNSEQDEIDEQLWKEICKRIESIINEVKYKSISPMSI